MQTICCHPCFGPKFFLDQAPKILDRDYKTEHAFDCAAKFRGDWPRDLGDLALKKEELLENIRPLGLSFRAA